MGTHRIIETVSKLCIIPEAAKDLPLWIPHLPILGHMEPMMSDDMLLLERRSCLRKGITPDQMKLAAVIDLAETAPHLITGTTDSNITSLCPGYSGLLAEV